MGGGCEGEIRIERVCFTSYLMHYKALPAEHGTLRHYIEN
jgi:hypothetical protein